MKKIIKTLLIFYIFLSIHSFAYASVHMYEAEEYIIKIKNINEKIEKIDLVNYEECEMEETGFNYTTTFEVVPLFGKDTANHLYLHNTESYYIKQIVRYNYLSGKAATDIEHTISGGKYKESKAGKLITYDMAREARFKNIDEFYKSCKEAKDNEFICVKTTTYKAYKLTFIKELDSSNIKYKKLDYNHDDFSNLDIGIRLKNKEGEYKTFISNENSMYMHRYGGKPIIEDKEKIIIFDYKTGTYESNSKHSFLLPANDEWINIIAVTIILLVIIILFTILNIIIKRRKQKNNSKK